MIEYIQGDLFESSSTILAHACNCQGTWGAGVARVFKSKFPTAFKEYNAHCKSHSPTELLGTTFLANIGDGRYVACMFTSNFTGIHKLSVKEIVHFTNLSTADLVLQINGKDVSMPKINSGLFGVPWEDTEEVLTPFTDDVDIKVYCI